MTPVTCCKCHQTYNAEVHDMHPTLDGTYYCAACHRALLAKREAEERD